MSNPKKKLSTKPIRIDLTETAKPDSQTLDSAILDSISLTTNKPDSIQLEDSSPELTSQRIQKPDSFLQESSNLVTDKHESIQLESSSSNSTNLGLQKLDSSLQDSVVLESKKLATDDLESTKERSQEVHSFKLDSENLETQSLDSGLEDYKKVAMRLSTAASERLKQLRVTTGIPYEILVDVMIRNWDSLPVRTQTAFLKEAQQVRASRLLAGQQKTMDTMQRKYASK